MKHKMGSKSGVQYQSQDIPSIRSIKEDETPVSRWTLDHDNHGSGLPYTPQFQAHSHQLGEKQMIQCFIIAKYHLLSMHSYNLLSLTVSFSSQQLCDIKGDCQPVSAPLLSSLMPQPLIERRSSITTTKTASVPKQSELAQEVLRHYNNLQKKILYQLPLHIIISRVFI